MITMINFVIVVLAEEVLAGCVGPEACMAISIYLAEVGGLCECWNVPWLERWESM